MKSSLPDINNENGSIIAIVLLLIAVLTVIGITSNNTAITESQIVRNETCYKRSFFRAEAAAIEAIQRMEDEADLLGTPPSFLLPSTTIDEDNELLDEADWDLNAQAAGLATPGSELRYIAVYRGVQSGSSLAMGSAQVHAYVVYGRDQDDCGGDVIVGIGYNKPF